MALIRRALASLGPLAMLTLFGAAFLHGPPDVDPSTSAPDCPDGVDAYRSVAMLERCVALAQTDVELLSELGAAYELEGRADRAEAAYRQALRLDPHDGNFHVRLGCLLLRRGSVDEARAEGEEALQWQPGHLTARNLINEASGQASGEQPRRASGQASEDASGACGGPGR